MNAMPNAMPKYTVWMTYFGYYLEGSWDNIKDAFQVGRSTGFSFTIKKDDLTVGFFEMPGENWRGIEQIS